MLTKEAQILFLQFTFSIHDPVLRLLLNDCKLMRNLTTSKVHFLVNKFGTFYKKNSQILLHASVQGLKRCFWSVHLKKKMCTCAK